MKPFGCRAGRASLPHSPGLAASPHPRPILKVDAAASPTPRSPGHCRAAMTHGLHLTALDRASDADLTRVARTWLSTAAGATMAVDGGSAR